MSEYVIDINSVTDCISATTSSTCILLSNTVTPSANFRLKGLGNEAKSRPSCYSKCLYLTKGKFMLNKDKMLAAGPFLAQLVE